MDQQKLQELYKLHERAKRMERMGNDSEALKIYLDIHENFFANTSDLYERPAVILEKKHRFDEAIAMCEKAIGLIQEDKISGTVEQFEKRIVRVQERMAKDAPVQEDSPKRFQLKLNPKEWVLKDWIKAIGLILILAVGLFILLPRQSAYDDVYIDMSEMERESELEGSLFNEEEEPSEYVITESMIEIAKNVITGNIEVLDASIAPQDGTIGFGIITSPGTSKDKSEALAIELIKTLSGVASAEYTELAGPNALSLGELYKHYDIVIAVGDSPENIIAKGTKSKGASLINWRD